MQKLAGVVILYNPSDDVYYNIMTYYPYLDKLYVLDNSEKINRRLIDKLEKLSKVLYICHKKMKVWLIHLMRPCNWRKINIPGS